MKRIVMMAIFLCAICLIAGSANAQSGAVYIKGIDGLRSGDTLNAGVPVKFKIAFRNNFGLYVNIGNGYKISTPDGAVWDSVTIDTIPPNIASGTKFKNWFHLMFDVGFSKRAQLVDIKPSSCDSVYLLGAGNVDGEHQFPDGMDTTVYNVSVWLKTDTLTNAGKHVCIDSAFYAPSGTWVWVGQDELGNPVEFYPEWMGSMPAQVHHDPDAGTGLGGGYCYTVYSSAQPPTLQVDSTSLNFTATEGGSNPALKIFNVTEAGGKKIAYTASESSSWISLTKSADSTPAQVTVAVNITGLTANTYHDSIQVASAGANGSPVWVKVNLTVNAAPKVAVSTHELTFTATEAGSNPVSKTFQVTETHGGSIPYLASEVATWISLENASGTGTPATVTVSIDISGLIAGDYTDTVLVTSSSTTNSEKVAVKLHVDPKPKTLVVSVDTLRYSVQEGSANPPMQSFVVTEAGEAEVPISILETATWINTSKVTGQTPDTIGVTVDNAGMGTGTYLDSIKISSSDASVTNIKWVFVKFQVTACPQLVVSKSDINASVYTGVMLTVTDSVNITSTGGDGLPWALAEVPAGFTFSANSGVTPFWLKFTYQNTYAEIGNYDACFQLVSTTAPGKAAAMACSSGVSVCLHIKVTEKPCVALMISDTLLSFSAFENSAPNPAWLSFSAFVADSTLEAPISIRRPVSDAEWVKFVVGNDTLTEVNGVTRADIRVIVDPTGLVPGTYTAPCVVTSDNASVCMPRMKTFNVALLVKKIIIPSSDTVIVANVPTVPGAQVAVPVDFANSCPTTEMYTHVFWTTPLLHLDSVSYLGTRVADPAIDKWQEAHETSVALKVTASTENPVAPGRGLWAYLYFSLSPEATPGTYPIDIVDRDTAIYFNRYCNEVSKVEIPEFIKGGLVVDTVADYICGWVVDPDGMSIPGATVQMWADFPQGSPLMTTMSTGIGSFAFAGEHPTPYDLYAYKEGYYPGTLEDLNFGAKGVKIVLRPLKQLTPCDQWVNYYCGENTLFGAPLPVGSVVEAFDPQGTLAGRQIVTEAGLYRFMPVYRDSAGSVEDEGAITGDILRFFVNGQQAIANGDVVYPATNFENVIVCLEAGAVVSKECQLHSGWNLISWNIDTQDDSIVDVFKSIEGSYEVILGFEGGGLTYDPDLTMFSTLWYADHQSGYWVKIKEGQSPVLKVEGLTVPQNTPIPVYRGWNLVGYLPGNINTPADALASVEGILQIAYGFDGGIKIYQPGQAQYNTLTQMASCSGYWMKLTENGQLVYPVDGPVPLAKQVGREQAARVALAEGLTPTTNWVNLYGANVTFDGAAVAAGSTITAVTDQGVLVGSFTLQKDGVFGFMPVYADNGTEKVTGLSAGNSFRLAVDGKVTEQTFTWTNNGDRILVSTLTAKGGSSSLPSNYSLKQNYPNPFNPSTNIRFTLPVAARARIEVFNVLGALVATPFDGMASAGENSVVWDGRNLNGENVGSGVYFYRLTADNYAETKKMMLLK